MTDPRFRQGVMVRVPSGAGYLDSIELSGRLAIVRVPRKIGLGGSYVQRWDIEDVEYVALGHAAPYGCLLAITPGEGTFVLQVPHQCDVVAAALHACAELRDQGRDPAEATWSFVTAPLDFVRAMSDVDTRSTAVDNPAG